MDQLVSQETYELVKEKGFKNYPCLLDNWLGIIWKPTQTNLQKWFREKHRINVESNYLPNIGMFVALYKPMGIIPKTYKNFHDYYNATSKYYSKNYHASYEGALEEGLKEATKLI